MKLTVLQENLKQGLNKVNRAISNRPQLPVLANVLLETRNGKLYLIGTDLELGIKVEIGAKVETDGRVTVPAKILGEFVNSIPSGKVEIEAEGKTLKINSGRYKANFQTMEADEFPQFPEAGRDENMIVFRKDDLEDALHKVIYAAAKDSMRPILTGVLFELGKRGWRVAATDGFRLAIDSGRYQFGKIGDGGLDLVIPLRGVMELMRMEAETIGLEVVKDLNQVIFSGGGTVVISQLLDGSFPNYKKIIPESAETKIRIEREGLLEGVKVAQVFARENSNVLNWSVGNKGVKISSKSPETGENEVFLDAGVEGREVEIAFNGKFLLDFLQNSEADEVEIGLGESLAPGSFREVGNDKFLYIVMPINL